MGPLSGQAGGVGFNVQSGGMGPLSGQAGGVGELSLFPFLVTDCPPPICPRLLPF
jgi:hypothetical protein